MARVLRLAILNSADVGGGAETVAVMLRAGMVSRGYDATLWVGRRGASGDVGGRLIPRRAGEEAVARRYASRGFFNLGLPWSRRFCDSAELSGADVIHLHNLHGHYFSMTEVAALAARAPLVWTLHDFFPLTGGCAFPFDCDRWLSTCGNCPQIGAYPMATPHDRTRRLQSIKRRAFRDLDVTIVTPSRHLGEAVARSGLFVEARREMIPYAVNTDRFHPHRDEARRALGIPADRPVVLVAAQGLNDPRKGVDHAMAALCEVEQTPCVVLLVGAEKGRGLEARIERHKVRALGYLRDRDMMARCFAAADVFLFTSLAENFPCVVMEAMASGTCVVAFDIDGVNEQIVSGKTGVLVPPGDTGRLTQALAELLNDRSRLAHIGAAAREHAVQHWTIDRFLDAHERLYGSVIGLRRAAGVGG